MDSADRNEDWLRGGYWDFPGVDRLGALLTVLGLDGRPEADQVAGVREFMALPAWQAAPAPLKREAEAFTTAD